MEPLKSIEEAADIWGVSPWTVRAYVRQGKIRPVRIGRRVLIEAQEIQRLIDEGRADQPQAEKGAPSRLSRRSSPVQGLLPTTG